MGYLVIDQAFSVKMAAWKLVKFFFCVFRDLDYVSVHKHAKKGRGQYPAILIEQAWSIKDLLYEIKHKFSLRDKAISRAWKIVPCVSARDLVHLVRSRSSSYNKDIAYYYFFECTSLFDRYQRWHFVMNTISKIRILDPTFSYWSPLMKGLTIHSTNSPAPSEYYAFVFLLTHTGSNPS